MSGIKILIFAFLLIDFLSWTHSTKTLMIINFIRHGNRTPGSIYPEVKHLFQHFTDKKKLSMNGYKQMRALGRILREGYLDRSRDFAFNLEKINESYLIISSPSQRTVESALAYSQGLFPEAIFKLYDLNNSHHNREPVPPIMENRRYKFSFPHFTLIIENLNQDMIFHSKKCHFKNRDDIHTKQNELNYMSPEEKKEVFNFLQPLFPETLGSATLETFNDKTARSIFQTMEIVNMLFKNKYTFPENVYFILKRLHTYYNYFNKVSNDNYLKLLSSAFFEQLLQFFEEKINNEQRNFITRFLSKYFGGEKFDFIPKIDGENFENLKFVTYSGHNGNMIGIMRNLLTNEQLLEKFNNFKKNQNLLHLSFASSIDFHLISHEDVNKYYVKIFVNGEEFFDKIRSKGDGYITYIKDYGIPYQEFRTAIQDRILENYKTCEYNPKK